MKILPKLLFLFLLVTSYQLLVTPVSAHILATDGNIGAVMHIDPDDDPVAGTQAGFFFEFKDKTNKFNPANCSCTISFLEDGHQLSSQPLFQNSATPSLDNASVFYTFPQKDVYQIIVTGSPQTPGSFQDFKLKYDVRVDRGTDQSTPTPQTSQTENWLSTHVIHVAGAVVISLFLVGALIKQHLAKSKQQILLNSKPPISKNVK